MIKAESIPLEFWQAPQSDVILIYGESECSIYFSCWQDRATPADYLGHLSFDGASAVRSFPREFTPYQAINPLRSSVLRVPDSDLAKNHIEYRKRAYPQWPIKNETNLSHYVVVGHDIYHEILAASFTANRIPKNQVTDPRLLNLIANE